MTWLLIRAFFGGALQKAWTFLSHRSFWQLAFGAALIFAGWEYIGKRAEQRHSAKVEIQLRKATAALVELSAAKNRQQIITKANIVTVTRTIHDAERQAEIVEKAPPSPACKTKPEVMGADL